MAAKLCFEPIKGKNTFSAHQACVVYRRLAKQMTAAKAKGGEPFFAQYLPTPRIGDFSNDQTKDAQILKRDRAKPKAIDRVQFRRSFTEYQWGKHPKIKPLFALCAKP